MRGQTLIEVVVAIGIFGVVMVAISTIIISSLSNVQYSKYQNQATQYAQEGMEVIRNWRDTSFGNFNTNPTVGISYCFPQSCTKFGPGFCDTSCPVPSIANIDNTFMREVSFSSDPLTCNVVGATIAPKKVQVTVKWTDGKCSTGQFCHQANIVSCLSDYTVGVPL